MVFLHRRKGAATAEGTYEHVAEWRRLCVYVLTNSCESKLNRSQYAYQRILIAGQIFAEISIEHITTIWL